FSRSVLHLDLHSFPTRRSSDLGPLNLYNAVLLATSPHAQGLGVLVTLNDAVHAARYVRKAHTTHVQAFSSEDDGCIGRIHNGRRSEEHTSELQSRENLVCRLLL